VISNHWN